MKGISRAPLGSSTKNTAKHWISKAACTFWKLSLRTVFTMAFPNKLQQTLKVNYSLGSCKAMHLKYNITITSKNILFNISAQHCATLSGIQNKSRVKDSKCVCVCVNQWFIHGAVWGLETERVCSSLWGGA